ncbi:nucleotidyltransferase domain-containing protein [candidate division WOR-3 bacterium]|nr:nucleotidyltransferase domain-containing protein [candidate division WOR-3 bacterium]
MSVSIRRLLAKLKDELTSLYGPRLRGVFLFGSYARGDALPGSDCDVLIVLDRVPDYGKEIDRTSLLVSRLSLEYRISISRVFVQASDWQRRRTSFLENVREEAVPA